MVEVPHGPFSISALREAVFEGREPAPAGVIARAASYRWFVVGTVCIGSCMGQIDASMTQLLLPRLELEFSARLSSVSWVAVSYLLAMASFTPIFGRLADMLGHKLLYTAGFLIFILGSGLCGLATGLPTLIAFRVLQAVGAALITSNSTAIIVMTAGADERGRALGLQSAAQAIGLCVGPALGGLILDTLGWHWAFWINVPVGLVAVVLAWLVIPRSESAPDTGRFDWLGALLIVPALTTTMMVLSEGHTWGIASPASMSCLALALVLLALFVRTERRASAPLLDLALLGRPAFLLPNAASFLSYAALFGLLFLVPFVLVRVYHDSALLAGLRLSILPVLLGLVAPLGGVLYDRLGAWVPACCGVLVCLGGLILLHLTLDGTAGRMPLAMLALALFGAGQGLFISPNNSAIMATAPAGETGQAASVLNVVRLLGISAGIAGASTLLAVSLDGRSTLEVPAALLIVGARDVIVLLVCLMVLAGFLSLIRPGDPTGRGSAGGSRAARGSAS